MHISISRQILAVAGGVAVVILLAGILWASETKEPSSRIAEDEPWGPLSEQGSRQELQWDSEGWLLLPPDQPLLRPDRPLRGSVRESSAQDNWYLYTYPSKGLSVAFPSADWKLRELLTPDHVQSAYGFQLVHRSLVRSIGFIVEDSPSHAPEDLWQELVAEFGPSTEVYLGNARAEFLEKEGWSAGGAPAEGRAFFVPSVDLLILTTERENARQNHAANIPADTVDAILDTLQLGP